MTKQTKEAKQTERQIIFKNFELAVSLYGDTPNLGEKELTQITQDLSRHLAIIYEDTMCINDGEVHTDVEVLEDDSTDHLRIIIKLDDSSIDEMKKIKSF